MRILDLYCGAGGAAMGMHRACPDAEIIGVDIKPQPRYPFAFFQGDALKFPLWGFDFIWASPPCQCFTVYRNNIKHIKNTHQNLIPATRERLSAQDAPWVMENVPGAPLRDPIRLCGTSFGIPVRRHRIFEASFPMLAPPCNHGAFTERRFPGSTNRPNGRTVCNVGEYRVPLKVQQEAMQIDWMNLAELSQAVPPVYSKFILEALSAMPALNEVEVAA